MIFSASAAPAESNLHSPTATGKDDPPGPDGLFGPGWPVAEVGRTLAEHDRIQGGAQFTLHRDGADWDAAPTQVNRRQYWQPRSGGATFPKTALYGKVGHDFSNGKTAAHPVQYGLSRPPGNVGNGETCRFRCVSTCSRIYGRTTDGRPALIVDQTVRPGRHPGAVCRVRPVDTLAVPAANHLSGAIPATGDVTVPDVPWRAGLMRCATAQIDNIDNTKHYKTVLHFCISHRLMIIG
jgi:hypothetical protein